MNKCAITGKECPNEYNGKGEKPCNTECEIGKQWLKENNGLKFHDED